jgi:RNA polymerase sigma-70 factor (ECF subfamily)
MDEKQAISELKKGNLDGLEALVALHQVRALRTSCLITGDLALAEDIVQEAFLKVFSAIDQFNDNLPFAPWFNRIVVNDSLKTLRRKRKDSSFDERNEEADFKLDDPDPLPEEVLESKETLQAVWSALDRLSPQQRVAFVMRFYLQMTEKDVAEILHGPIGTIKWWIYSARLKLRGILFADQRELFSGYETNPEKEYKNE